MMKKFRFHIHCFLNRHAIAAAKQRHQARLAADQKAKTTALEALNTDTPNTTVYVTKNALERGAENLKEPREFRVDHVDVWKDLELFKQPQTVHVNFGGIDAGKQVEADVYIMGGSGAVYWWVR